MMTGAPSGTLAWFPPMTFDSTTPVTVTCTGTASATEPTDERIPQPANANEHQVAYLFAAEYIKRFAAGPK